MIEIFGDIFKIAEETNIETILLISTNGLWNTKGAIMGRGIAAAAKEKFPGIEKNLGTMLRIQHTRLKNCEKAEEIEPWNIPYKIASKGHVHVFSFPTKPTRVVMTKDSVLPEYFSPGHIGMRIEGWKGFSSLPLIERSAKFISTLVGSSPAIGRVLLPHVGCSNGGLKWVGVKPVLDKYFDEKYIVVERP